MADLVRDAGMILGAVRGVGVSRAMAAFGYTLRKKDQDRRQGYWGIPPVRYHRGGVAPAWVSPGSPGEPVCREGEVALRFARAALVLRAPAPDMIDVTWEGVAGEDAAREDAYDDLPIPKWKGPFAPVEISPAEEGWVFRTADLSVTIGGDGSLVFREGVTGSVLRREAPPLFEDRGAVLHQALLSEREAFHGLGGRAASLDLRGGAYGLWNRDPHGYGAGDDPLYLCLPVYYCRGPGPGYLVFYANSYPAVFDLGRADPLVAAHSFGGGVLRYYLALGPARRALERYTALTGRPALPPLWALGYHQSRWSYAPEARVREVAAAFSRHDLPGDAIHLDIDYLDGFRVFTVDRRGFPDLAGLARDLREVGLSLVAIIDPGVKVDRSYAVFREGSKRGFFLTLPGGKPVVAPVWPGHCVFPDFSRGDVRDWWGEHYGPLVEAGIAGFWHDMNEPAAFTSSGDATLPLRTCHATGDHLRVHNLYGLEMAQAGWEALRRQAPDRRPFIVSRSGWAGLQRYAWNWTGDIDSTWSSLRQTAVMITGLGLSGIPFTGSDVGGFIGRPGPELYLRWLQMATFHPFFRSHTSRLDPDQAPWSYGEPYMAIARDFLRLRYALLPYLYALAWEAAERGWPLVRPLFWADEAAGAAEPSAAPPGEPLDDDVFMLGDALLVAPVTESGVFAREVPLPRGRWYDFWTDEPLDGPGRVSRVTPLERLPVLVRAGSIIPAEVPAPSTRRRSLDRLYLHLYPPAAEGEAHEGRLRLYTDAGDGYSPGRLDDFILRRVEGSMELEWQPVGGERAGDWPYGEVVLVAHSTHSHDPGRGAAPRPGAVVDPRAIPEMIARRPGRYRVG